VTLVRLVCFCNRLNLHTKYFILSYHSPSYHRRKTTTVSSDYFPETKLYSRFYHTKLDKLLSSRFKNNNHSIITWPNIICYEH
jgi:hypothetical protein